MSKLSLWKTILLLCVVCAVGAIGSPADTFKTLLSFNGTNGAEHPPRSLYRVPTGTSMG